MKSTSNVEEKKTAHPIQFQKFGHINIVVHDIEKATSFYKRVFGAIPEHDFPHFRNVGFAKSAGFMEHPEKVDVSIRILTLPTPNPLYIELMQYHSPKGKPLPPPCQTNDEGGIRHISLRVSNILEAFQFLKTIPEVRMISSSADYKPFKIDPICQTEFKFYDKVSEANPVEKEKMCDAIGSILYFYFLDPFGVQWELEQSH